MSSLALSLTKEVSGEEEEEAESRDMAEAEGELNTHPLEVLSEASAGVLSSAATFCCGGQETASKVKTELPHADETDKSSVKSQTAGTNVNSDPSVRDGSFFCLHFLYDESVLVLCLPPVPRRSSAGSPESLMFVRLRVQPPAGKKKGVGGLQLGSAKTSRRRDAWLALSQERCSN